MGAKHILHEIEYDLHFEDNGHDLDELDLPVNAFDGRKRNYGTNFKENANRV